MKKYLIFSVITLFFIPNFCIATCTRSSFDTQVNCSQYNNNEGQCRATSGCDWSSDSSSNNTQTVTLNNPLGNNNPNVNQMIGRIINSILGIVGSLALLMFVYGGLIWMTAAGASEKVQKGKDIILWAIIGLIMVFMSYAAVNFVLRTVLGGAA